MLCRMVFCLSGKVVPLLLDNTSAKTYLCNQGGTVSLSRPDSCIFNPANKHGISIIQA